MTTCPIPDNPSDCRARLLQAACEVFSAEGYRAGVDRIAAVAGVAKQTLYNHFPSKAELFAAAVRMAVDEMLESLVGQGGDLRERLVGFGTRYRERLLSPSGLGFYRAIVAEASRFPELSAAFYRSGPQEAVARLRVVLAEAMACGELRRDDPEFAATLLLSMLVGHERSHALFSGESSPALDPATAGRIVDCFLRAFAPELKRSTS
jgi:TetR/AcrR family transcriptional repressor of mexJK operon